jgi:hypothetical protein
MIMSVILVPLSNEEDKQLFRKRYRYTLDDIMVAAGEVCSRRILNEVKKGWLKPESLASVVSFIRRTEEDDSNLTRRAAAAHRYYVRHRDAILAKARAKKKRGPVNWISASNWPFLAPP